MVQGNEFITNVWLGLGYLREGHRNKGSGNYIDSSRQQHLLTLIETAVPLLQVAREATSVVCKTV